MPSPRPSHAALAAVITTDNEDASTVNTTSAPVEEPTADLAPCFECIDSSHPC